MRIYYDASRNEIHVDATVDVWPARSLAVRIVPSGLMVYKANAGVDVLGPLTPDLVQQADGTSFSDQQAALLYLQGEFAKTLIGLSERTVEVEFEAQDGEQKLTIPLPFAAVQSVFINGIRQRPSSYAVEANIVTTPEDIVAGDFVNILYYPI